MEQGKASNQSFPVGKPAARKERKRSKHPILIFSLSRSKNHSYQCISKADPERESSSFARMGITAALTLLQV